MKKNFYYIQDSRKYVGNDVLWWGLNNGGYTTDLSKAEMYTREEAQKICKDRSTDIMWPVEYVDSRSQKVVDMQKLDRSRLEK